MRKISSKSIFVFLLIFTPTTSLAIMASYFLAKTTPAAYFSFLFFISSILFVYLLNLLSLRLFIRFFPMVEGDYSVGSREEFIYHVYALHYLLLFNSSLPSLFIPVPIMHWVYIALGAKLGVNSYSSGVILDPPFVTVGDNTILGYDSVICPHAVEGPRLSFYSIKIGSNVTIGMKSMILAGAIIEDDSIVAAGSVVTKGTHIKTGEVWGGTPARRLRVAAEKIAV